MREVISLDVLGIARGIKRRCFFCYSCFRCCLRHVGTSLIFSIFPAIRSRRSTWPPILLGQSSLLLLERVSCIVALPDQQNCGLHLEHVSFSFLFHCFPCI
jgi:hypothetical protein